MRDFLKHTFRDMFSEISVCSDGIYALDEYEKHRPDWVFMDIKMNQLDGIEATRLIVSRFQSARIIIVTDYDNDKLRAKALKAEASHYVTKDNILNIFNIINKGKK